MPSIRTLAIAFAAIIVTVGLGGCAAVPGSVEEQLWFDKAVGPDIYDVPPGARMRGAIGYPRTACCERAVPVTVEEP